MSGMATEMVCGECGATNQAGEDFCGECGSYLEWESSPVAEEPQPVVEEAPVEEAPKTVVERVKAAVGLAPEAEEATSDATTEEVQPTAPTVEKPPGAGAIRTGKAPEGKPPAAVKPEAPVTAVRPGTAAPKPRRRPTAPQDQPIRPGDLICGSCGAGNAPTRKFCRRCGKELAEAQVARIPWWRRPFVRRARSGPDAGTRPKQRRQRRAVPPVAKYVAVLVVLAGLVYLSRPLWSPVYENVMDRVEDADPVTPDRYTASSFAPGHRPGLVKDGFANRYWAPDTTGPVRGEWIKAEFAEPIRLVRMEVISGAGAKDAQFQAQGRPVDLTAVVTSSDGTESEQDVTLKDEAGVQLVDMGFSDVTAVELRIDKAVRGDRPRSRVAVAEIKLLAR
jgi:ribosomal protein L40E